MKKIILASASPRRREILSKTGLPFEVVESGYEEDMKAKKDPIELAKFLAQNKAKDVAAKYDNCLIIGADTFVVLNDDLLGKPHTEPEAIKTLQKISDKTLSVITGFAIIDTETDTMISEAVSTKVFIKELTDGEIDAYVKTGEPLDKAGAFGIQERGALLVEKIEGDYFNVVGLPLFALSEALKKFDVHIFR